MDQFKVIGYYAGWNGMQKEKLDFDVLTHIIYAFAIPMTDGHLRPMDHPELIKELAKEAHANGCKFSIAIGGWSYLDILLEATFVEATNTPEKISIMVEDAANLCEEYELDGIDLDWEHPRMKDGSYKQYEALIKQLADRMHAMGKYLTSAVLSGVAWDGEVYEDSASHTDAVLAAVDWLNVMTYDGGEGIRHSTYDFAVNCMKYWREERGLAKEKVMMGVPFYSFNPSMLYEQILKEDPEGFKKDMIVVDGKEYHYNGQDTMQKKTEYALANCGGVMIWELTEDTTCKEHSLLQTIKATIRG